MERQVAGGVGHRGCPRPAGHQRRDAVVQPPAGDGPEAGKGLGVGQGAGHGGGQAQPVFNVAGNGLDG